MTRVVRFSAEKDVPPTINDASGLVQYGEIRGEEVTTGTERLPLSSVRLLPPCSPTKIICVGRNYAEHARELGNEVPEEPLIFLKPPSSLIAHNDDIVYPGHLSKQVDYEGELGVIIGTRARSLTPANALDCVRGFTIVNDVTARDLQRADKKNPWMRGKGFDTFCPTGPWMIPKDEIDISTLRIRTLVDGEVKQDGSVRDMIFPIVDILVFITQFLSLEPGDLLATGTPPGVGPVQLGSVIRVEIAGIGTLENRVISQR